LRRHVRHGLHATSRSCRSRSSRRRARTARPASAADSARLDRPSGGPYLCWDGKGRSCRRLSSKGVRTRMRSITDAPPRAAVAQFDRSFGQRFLLTVDTEEEFDWNAPLTREGHGLNHVAQLAGFQEFCESEGVVPVYLVDWPIAQSPQAAEILRGPLATGKAEIGVQLHPWVNPPFDEDVTARNSFAGSLPPELERAKFRALRDAIEANFGANPVIYRAGRYGIGPNSAAMLAEDGIAIDTSVRANFDYSAASGPDFRHHPLVPYWLDETKTLLELPLTTVFWGML